MTEILTYFRSIDTDSNCDLYHGDKGTKLYGHFRTLDGTVDLTIDAEGTCTTEYKTTVLVKGKVVAKYTTAVSEDWKTTIAACVYDHYAALQIDADAAQYNNN